MIDKDLQQKQKSLKKQIELLKLKLSYEIKIKELKKNLDSLKMKYAKKSKSISGKSSKPKDIKSKIFTKKNAVIGSTGLAGLAGLVALYKLYKSTQPVPIVEPIIQME